MNNLNRTYGTRLTGRYWAKACDLGRKVFNVPKGSVEDDPELCGGIGAILSEPGFVGLAD